MGIRTLDSVLVQQAVITGRVINDLTGDALNVTPSVNLSWRIAGAGRYNQSRVQPQYKRGGYFVFRGAPESFFPPLEADQNLECLLTATAAGYGGNSVEFSLTRAQATPATVTETYSGFEVELLKLDAPVQQIDIPLQPEPVSLAGWIVEDNDMDSPVAGASVSIIVPAGGGSATSDEHGYFRIDDLPVVERVTLQIEFDGETVSGEFLLDYGQRINKRVFSLSA